MSKGKMYAFMFVFSVVFSIAFNVWLDSGCGAPFHTGVITTHGKTCLK